jgi:hypothetical protein
MRAMRLAAAVLLAVAAPALAQTPGPARFRVYENGALVGSITMSLVATDSGWRVHGASEIKGSVAVVIPNLDLYYDEAWRGRFMTLEMKAPDDVILHAAVIGDTTRTDIVRATEARFRANAVSPDTIFLPDRAYGAYEAVAARLAGAVPGFDLPLFVPPFGETRAAVEDRADVQVTTRRGSILATRFTLTEIRERPTPVEIWINEGRLLRLELPRAGISVVRDDIVR